MRRRPHLALAAVLVAGMSLVALDPAVGAPTSTSPATTVESVSTPPTTVVGAATTLAEIERERVADPETRRVMDLLTGVLIGLAVLVLVITVWFWRSTRPLPASLEPLATMSSRRFRRRAGTERDEALDAVHRLKAATDPPPRAADFLRQVRGEDG